MSHNLLILLIIVLVSLSGCMSSNIESSHKEAIQVPCEISNGNRIIGCGKVPISIRDDINKKLSPNCNINFDDFNEKSKKCLEENYNRPADIYLLGNLKYFGHHFTQDQELKLIKIAAEHSNPEANAWLGEYYAKKGDIPQSVKYTTVVVELGSPMAMHKLAGRYIRGQGVEKDTEKALLLLNQTKTIFLHRILKLL